MFWFENPIFDDLDRIQRNFKKVAGVGTFDKFVQKEQIVHNMIKTITSPLFVSALQRSEMLIKQFDTTAFCKNMGISDSLALTLKAESFSWMREYSELLPKFDFAEKMLASTVVLQQHAKFLDTIMLGTPSTAIRSVTQDTYELIKGKKISEDSINIEDEKIQVEENTYTIEEFRTIIKECVNESLNERKVESLPKRTFDAIIYWVNIVLFFVSMCQGGEYIDEKFLQPAIAIIQNTTNIEYVIRPTAYIREKADPKSKILKIVRYSEQIEILDEVPFWCLVKYKSEEKNITGWISKISIGTENDIE